MRSNSNNNSSSVDDSHEMAAFMKMFMDLVSIFNEDQTKVNFTVSGRSGGKGNVSFGMMFGNSHDSDNDEWSTVDGAEGRKYYSRSLSSLMLIFRAQISKLIITYYNYLYYLLYL